MVCRLSEGATLEVIDGESVLVTGQGDTAILNETGSVVIRKLLEGKTLEEAAAYLSENYLADAEQALADSIALVDSLLSCGFIEEAPCRE